MIKVAILDDYQDAFQQIVDVENYKDKFDFKIFNEPFLKAPLLSLISVILSNISIGGRGNLALPGPNSLPSPQLISSSYE